MMTIRSGLQLANKAGYLKLVPTCAVQVRHSSKAGARRRLSESDDGEEAAPATKNYTLNYKPRTFMPINWGVKFVPNDEVWVVERMGKFHKTAKGGLNFFIPLIDSISYVHTIKEVTVEVSPQSAVTFDNVSLSTDGVIYLKMMDPVKASYGVDSPYDSIATLAQSFLRAGVGELTLDALLKERAKLNKDVTLDLAHTKENWGIEVLRFEIKEIYLPDEIKTPMQLQASAERHKRAAILKSEGEREAEINVAQGKRTAQILASEGEMQEKINKANGEAAAIIAKATATGKGIREVAESISQNGGSSAVSMSLAEKYIESFGNLAKTSTTLMLPADAGNVSSMVAQASSVFSRLVKAQDAEQQQQSKN